MFGYIRPQKSELLVREFEQYKGIYCSLCRQLGKSYGPVARLTLSYDCAFYAMLLLSLQPKCTGFHTGRCVVNPMKKCMFCSEGEEEFVQAAALSVLLTYAKLKDDIEDSRFLGKLRGCIFLPFAASAKRKAEKQFPELANIVKSYMEQQKAAERMEPVEIDRCAEPTANMLSRVFAVSETENDSQSPEIRIRNEIGYYLGRWIYLMDAADDIRKDLKKHSFNPFVQRYQLNENSTDEEILSVRDHANQALNMTLSRLIAAFHLLEIKHFESILGNVIIKGLPEIQRDRLYKEEKTNVRSL
ncbi:MAG TPA: hypothetical protein GXX74_06755 [Clostridiales bacterium]|nr:hypothetical protein [Clostridiales bacterium]